MEESAAVLLMVMVGLGEDGDTQTDKMSQRSVSQLQTVERVNTQHTHTDAFLDSLFFSNVFFFTRGKHLAHVTELQGVNV